MDILFSQQFDQSSGLVRWSSDGRYLAIATGQWLVVRELAGESIKIAKGGLKPCQDKIEALEWASDSDLLLCGLYKRSLVEVFSMSRPAWRCRIHEGMAGLVRAQWTPDARHVITFSDFGLHMSVWSLTTRQVHTVHQPKAPPGCIAFSPDSRVMAIVTRRNCRDIVRLYNASTWDSLGEFTAETLDLCNLEWSPNGSALCLQDTSLEYRVLFYSPTGELLGRLEAYSNALGVKNIAWSPNGALLSVGSYDQCARLVSALTWKTVAVLKHVHPRTQPGCGKVACFHEEPTGQRREEEAEIDKENDVDQNFAVGSSGVPAKTISRAPSLSSFVTGAAKGLKPRHFHRNSTLKPRVSSKDVATTYMSSLTKPIPEEKPDPSKPFPRLGVGQIMSWSSDGRYLVTRNDNMGSALWVWDAEKLSLSTVVIQMEAVRSAKWCPIRNTLAICTGNPNVYFWSPEDSSSVEAPWKSFDIMGLRWSPDGKSLVLLSKEKFCRCILPEPGEPSQGGGKGGNPEGHADDHDVGGGVEEPIGKGVSMM